MCVDWINVVQNRDKWWAVVNTVMKLRVPYMRGISWLAEKLYAYQEGLCPMELVSLVVI